MTIIQLQYFQAVCKYVNYTKAAEELHITQPAISSAMRDLEKECRVALFCRDKNSLRITDEGYVLLKEASLLLEQYEHINHVVKDLSLSRKYIRVGLSTLSGNLVYPVMRQNFLERYPDIQVISAEESTKKQFEMLDNDLLDVIITIRRYENEEKRKEFDKVYSHWPLVKTSLMFCVGRGNSLANETGITLERMVQEPLVLLKDNYNQTVRIKEMFRQNGLTPRVIHYTNQMYTIERFVEKNIAAGFLPHLIAEKNPDITGLSYPEADPQYVEVFWKKDHFQFAATKLFIDMVKELYPQR